MSFSHLATDAESLVTFVSALVTIVGLPVLLRQISQSNSIQASQMNQAIYTRTTDVVMAYEQQPLSELFARVYGGETEFKPFEIMQLSYALRVNLLGLKVARLQYLDKYLDKNVYQTIEKGFAITLSQPVFRALWLTVREAQPAEDMFFVDGLISAAPLVSAVDISARLKDNLAEVHRREEARKEKNNSDAAPLPK